MDYDYERYRVSGTLPTKVFHKFRRIVEAGKDPCFSLSFTQNDDEAMEFSLESYKVHGYDIDDFESDVIAFLDKHDINTVFCTDTVSDIGQDYAIISRDGVEYIDIHPYIKEKIASICKEVQENHIKSATPTM